MGDFDAGVLWTWRGKDHDRVQPQGEGLDGATTIAFVAIE